MPYDPKRHVGRLVRLDPGCYRGRSFVHWTMTFEQRGTGWLEPRHHAAVRELLCHALARFQLVCPTYCLMPDHAHFLWVGLSEESDQKKACALFRRAWMVALSASQHRLQKQPFDHVLREQERERDSFCSVAHYVLENPVRARLAARWEDYPFCGAIVPGYPLLEPLDDDFWPRFWAIFTKLSSGVAERVSVSSRSNDI